MRHDHSDMLLEALFHCGEQPPVVYCGSPVPLWASNWAGAVIVANEPGAAEQSFAWQNEAAWADAANMLGQWLDRIPVFDCEADAMPEAAWSVLTKLGITRILTRHGSQWESHALHWRARMLQRLHRFWTMRRRRSFLRRHAVNLLPGKEGFRNDGGACWSVCLPNLEDCADNVVELGSPLVLFENLRPLGMAHSPHNAIRNNGNGRYSHWAGALWFSASDNSDPNGNGRQYSYWLKTPDLEPHFNRLFLGSSAASGEGKMKKDWHLSKAGLVDANPNAVRHKVHLIIGYLGAGGAERQICNLAAGLKEVGWSPTILAQTLRGAGGHFSGEMHDLGIPLQALDDRAGRPGLSDLGEGWLRLVRAAKLLRSLPDEIRGAVVDAFSVLVSEAPELVICYLDKTNIIGGLAAVLAGVPRILIAGRNLNPTHFPYLYRDWFHDLYHVVLTSPRVTLIANSHAGAQSYASWLGLPEARVPVVHNGLSEAAIGNPSVDDIAKVRFELGIGSDVPLILGVFRLSPEKRPNLFIDIVARLRETFPTLHAAIAGDGNITDEVAGFLRETGQDSFVTLLGRRNDVPALLCAADLVLHVSEAEGVPNALMEAQWMGCPVVATAGGGTPEIITPVLRPYLHAVDDVEGLYRSCHTLLCTPALRERLGDRIRGEARMRFSVSALVENTLAVSNKQQHEPELTVIETRKKPPPRIVAAFSVVAVSVYMVGVLVWLLATGKLSDPGLKHWFLSLFRRRVRSNLTGITQEVGKCYIAPVPKGLISDSNGVSALHLLEDGRPIGPGHSGHADIRNNGGGRFSHWGDRLYFSTPDDTDPTVNGRTYTVVESKFR